MARKSGFTLRYEIVDEASLPPNPVTRAFYDGKDTSTHIAASMLSFVNASDQILKVVRKNKAEYIRGCASHANCIGHITEADISLPGTPHLRFGSTDTGVLLLPPGFCSIKGRFSNQCMNAALEVYSSTNSRTAGETYRSRLLSMLGGKEGKLRAKVMACPIEGSIRTIISPCWPDEMGVIYIPKSICDNIRVLRPILDPETGEETSTLEETCVREGDWCMICRPPTIQLGSIQLMRVRYWPNPNANSIGIPIWYIKPLVGDYDGDEIQINFLLTMAAIAICLAYKDMPDMTFHKAQQEYSAQNLARGEDDKPGSYMLSTTLSLRQMLEGKKLPPHSNAAKFKLKECQAMVQTIKSRSVYKDHYHKSVDAMINVIHQQKTLGPVGGLSRLSKLLASDFDVTLEGDVYLNSNDGRIAMNINISPIIHPGNVFMRAVMSLSRNAMQGRLDAHRTGRESSRAFDIADDLFNGGTTTLIGLHGSERPPGVWSYTKGDITYIEWNTLLDPVAAFGSRIIAVYNIYILGILRDRGYNIFPIARLGVSLAAYYSGSDLTSQEIASYASILCAYAGSMKYQPSSRHGIEYGLHRYLTSLLMRGIYKARDILPPGGVGLQKAVTISELVFLYNF